ncbi:MAG: tetratricopeptide repeat protein [Pirellulaceae bacterium]
MSMEFVRTPILDRFYQQFLRDENSARFICSTTQVYCIGTLHRLALYGQRLTRRAASLAIGFLGDMTSNETMGRCLRDGDRAVRMLADHGLRQIWSRSGGPMEQSTLRRITRLNQRSQFHVALDLAEQLCEDNRYLAEAWNQRAIASFGLSEYDRAIDYAQETVFLNRYHFLTVVGMGNAFLQLDNVQAALESFRLALDINPDLDNVRGQVQHLEKIQGE